MNDGIKKKDEIEPTLSCCQRYATTLDLVDLVGTAECTTIEGSEPFA